METEQKDDPSKVFNAEEEIKHLQVRKLKIELDILKIQKNHLKIGKPNSFFRDNLPIYVQLGSFFIATGLVLWSEYVQFTFNQFETNKYLIEVSKEKLATAEESFETERKNIEDTLAWLKDSLALVQSSSLALSQLVEKEQIKNNELAQSYVHLKHEIEDNRQFDKWGFALYSIKTGISINHPKVKELIEHARNNGRYKEQILHSLSALIKRSATPEYHLFLMYLATKSERWKKLAYDYLELRIKNLDSIRSLHRPHTSPYISHYNELEDKYALSSIIINGLWKNEKVNVADKTDLLNQVSFFSEDTAFQLQRHNFQLFCTYIRLNEEVIEEPAIFYAVTDPIVNIAHTCPQLFATYGLAVKTMGIEFLSGLFLDSLETKIMDFNYRRPLLTCFLKNKMLINFF